MTKNDIFNDFPNWVEDEKRGTVFLTILANNRATKAVHYLSKKNGSILEATGSSWLEVSVKLRKRLIEKGCLRS